MIDSRTNGAAQKLAETTRNFYRADHRRAVAVQEQHTKFAWGLIEQSRKQQETFQALVKDSSESTRTSFTPLSPHPKKNPGPTTGTRNRR